MKKLNKLSKIISMTIAVCMLVSICSMSVVFADGAQILADPTYEYYTTIDTTSNSKNTYGIYMEDQYVNLPYLNSSFVGKASSTSIYAAIAWPPELKTTRGAGYPEQNAELDLVGSDYILKSNTSKVKYRLPARVKPTVEQVTSGKYYDLNETLIIDYARSWMGGVTNGISGIIDIGKKYEKIHILIGHASDSTDGYYGRGQVQAHIIYDDADETTTLPEVVTVSQTASKKDYVKFPNDLIDASESDGSNGYICETLPLVSAQGQSAADNFVADFESYVSTGKGSYGKNEYQGNFSKDDERITLAAFEYTLINPNPNKVVKQIKFSQTSGMGGYIVLGVSGENEREDWADKVIEINAAIDNLEEKGSEASAADVTEAMELVNSAIDAGGQVPENVNIEKFNSLFSNEEFTGSLVDAMLEGVDLENVTWDDTTEKFKDLDDVASVIEATNNLVEGALKDKILEAYTGMIDSLINEEEKDNDEMLERFELLKSAKTDEFREKFEEKVIYSTTVPSISADPEYVIFKVNFSKPVDSAVFENKDNYEILCGNKKIDSSWITVIPNPDGKGAEIKVLNSQDYSKPYTLTVSKNVRGSNGEAWAYLLTAQDSALAPFIVSTTGVTLTAPRPEDPITEKIFKGTISLNNISGSDSSCEILIASYGANGKYLGTMYVPTNGTASKGLNSFNFEGRLPEGAKEVLCYIYDSVMNMTLLTPPITIEIPAE